MPNTKSRIDALLPLTLPMFHMLLALSDGERHGYALKREILHRTDGKMNLGSGVLYGSINKLLEQGLIEESDERPDPHLDDERRRYYRITPLGLRVAQAEALRMRDLAQFAQDKLRAVVTLGIAGLLAIGILTAPQVRGQEQTPPVFEGASVRLTPPGSLGYTSIGPYGTPYGTRRFTATKALLAFLVQIAFAAPRSLKCW